MSHNTHGGGKFENFIHNILDSKFKKLLVVFITLAALVGSIMMFPSKLVMAKMLPGKSTNTFTVYIDTPSGSSISQTKKAIKCVTDILQIEQYV
ncbi:MAG: efflux RND transporter permease subunit, partial [Flavobacteriaceae bacterium]|nr:efflux RND transporter permease subunit [Flavobacteriaceae bacterium]